MPDMITIHSMVVRREGGARGGRWRSQGEGAQTESKVSREGVGDEGWGERERGRKLFILVGDNNDLIHSLLCCLSVGRKSHVKAAE